MGLSSSKHSASPSSSSGPVVHRSRSTRSRILNSSCLGSHRADNNDPQVSNCPSEKNGKSVSCPSENKSGPCRASAECYTTDKAEQSDDMNCINSSIELHEWAESSFTGTREGSTSRAFSSRSLNRPNRFLSRFSFYPGNLSFRLNRTNSLGSARSTKSFTISNEDEECVGPSGDLMSRNVNPRGCDFFPACFSNRSPRTRDDPNFSNNFQDNQDLDSGNDVLINRDDTIPNLFSTVNHNNNDGGGIRHIDRRVAAREPVERNVRFSRTLSVGRLRDRVLRRTPPDYNFQEDSEVRHTRHINGHAEMEATSGNNNFSETVSSSADESSNFSDPFHGSQNHVYETARTRETRYRDLLEHRSNFLERRRRIRSQVRALQRLGSRFENLSGHERACILSGQHRGGHCNCRFAAQEANSNDDPNARASMSRIVMLAEALFEVLDEIHQQSVVLSSRPSVSSIGSVPAPNDVVDSLPLKIFSKLKKKPSDDAAQCYICLVEYDDGDSIRVLPCHHEFHRACVDKWLKEIHRVCPLCRGDICHPGSLTAHN